MIQQTDPETRFLLARYVPDLRRMEPRNIGVIAWSPRTSCACRFIDPDAVDFDVEVDNFNRWKRFWVKQCETGVTHEGTHTPVNSSDFADALLKTQRGNYMLVDGGIMLERDAANDVDSVAQQLFDELVQQPAVPIGGLGTEDRARTDSVRKTCRDLFDSLGLMRHPNMRTSFKASCQVRGASEDFFFDFKWQPDKSRSQLINAVNIGHRLSVLGTAFTFEYASEARTYELRNAKFAAAIDSTDSRLDPTLVSRHIDTLGQFGTVIDFANENAPDEIASLLAL